MLIKRKHVKLAIHKLTKTQLIDFNLGKALPSLTKSLENPSDQAASFRRLPSQERSKKRYDAILAAAKQLISEKGSLQLKIQDIAKIAGVTPASIYQYFPSKNSITYALAQHTFDHAFDSLEQNLPKASTLEQACFMLQEMIEMHYEIYKKDPALIDIWVSVSADKSMQDLDLQDSRRQAELIFSCIKSFFHKDQWNHLFQVSFLLSHLVGSAVRMALQVGEIEGRGLIDSFKALLNPSSIKSMLISHNASTIINRD